MNDEHFPLKIDFWYFGPSKVLNSFADGKRADAWETDAHVKLSISNILNRMRVNPVSFKASSDNDKLIVHGDDILARLTLSV